MAFLGIFLAYGETMASHSELRSFLNGEINKVFMTSHIDNMVRHCRWII